jgi:hypothetical protein
VERIANLTRIASHVRSPDVWLCRPTWTCLSRCSIQKAKEGAFSLLWSARHAFGQQSTFAETALGSIGKSYEPLVKITCYAAGTGSMLTR